MGIRKRYWILFAVFWLIWLWLCEPPRRWEDMTPAELLRHDIDATAWGWK